MGVIEEWKDEYAEALAFKPEWGSRWHHVHPRVPGGYAHCDKRVKLLMGNVQSAPPADMPYCERCEAIASRNQFLRRKPR